LYLDVKKNRFSELPQDRPFWTEKGRHVKDRVKSFKFEDLRIPAAENCHRQNFMKGFKLQVVAA